MVPVGRRSALLLTAAFALACGAHAPEARTVEGAAAPSAASRPEPPSPHSEPAPLTSSSATTTTSPFPGTWTTNYTVTGSCALFHADTGAASTSTHGTTEVTITESEGRLHYVTRAPGDCPITLQVEGDVAAMIQDSVTCGQTTTSSAAITSHPNGTLTLHMEGTFLLPPSKTPCPLTTEATLTRLLSP